MEVVRALEPGLIARHAALTIGKFDGVHLGHRLLIETTVERARTLDLASAVLTWEPHPSAVIRPGQPLELLTSLDEKIEQIALLGPDLLVVAPFTPATMTTSADDYMAAIAAAIPLRELWVGEDFAMGKGRAGDVPSLMVIGTRLGFAVGAVQQVIVGDQPVSASRVRALLNIGEVEAIVALLGRPYGLRGVVVPGDQRGRLIGFPTANLQPAMNHALPANGVYACHVTLGGEVLPAVTNIGVRPTFQGTRRTVEAHLLDWSGDLYGRTIGLSFLHRLRGEQKFAGIEPLIAQIRRDADQARELLAR